MKKYNRITKKYIFICDYCARQIVNYAANNKHCVGPPITLVDYDIHCCQYCDREARIEEEEYQAKLQSFGEKNE